VTYTDADIRRAWLDAFRALWAETIRDIEPGQPDERDWIDQMWRDLGWAWLVDSRGEPGYDEAPESWCGAGPAWVGCYRLGDHLEADQCVDAWLREDIAKKILPGTGRLYDANRWRDIGFAEWPGTTFEDGAAASAIEPGVIVTVGDGADGAHIVMVDDVIEYEGAPAVETIEANGWGVLGDGRYGEGIIRRYDVEVPDYQGNTYQVEPRKLNEVKCLYAPTTEWVEGLGGVIRQTEGLEEK